MTEPSPIGRIRLFPTIVLLLIFGSLGLAFFFFSSSPVSAAIFAPLVSSNGGNETSGVATLTPTQENLWAFVNLPKATYTPTPLYTPTDLSAFTPTETPGVMDMQIVANVPVYQAQAAPVYSGAKYILVDISDQHMYVYESDVLVYSFVASTGINNATRVGTFAVQSKIPNAYGATWNIWMPSWLGIYWAGGLENGIHALPILSNGATLWAGFLGRPISYGCVVLGSYEAQLLYDWAEIGTPVEIRW